MEYLCPLCGIDYESAHAMAMHVLVSHPQDIHPEEAIPALPSAEERPLLPAGSPD